MRKGASWASRFGAIVAALAFPLASLGVEYVPIPSGTLVSVIAGDAELAPIAIDAFEMRVSPVTNAEFLAYVTREPAWRRGRAPSAFADASYLHQWQAPTVPGNSASASQPVVSVSWFAAEAFCESEGAHLPTWYEWEYVAAADETHRDARADPAWRARILAWYARPSNEALANVGGAANAYGVRDLHGLVWEWVDDFNSLLVSADSRNQGDADKLQYCGAGAISLKDRDNYAVLMRIALLSSLGAADTTRNLGFRCARNTPKAAR